jgi:hypothetical protein
LASWRPLGFYAETGNFSGGADIFQAHCGDCWTAPIVVVGDAGALLCYLPAARPLALRNGR